MPDAPQEPQSPPHGPSRRSVWRLRFVVGAIITAIVGAAMAGWLIARTSSPPTGPVIVISIDTLRADHLPAYGYRHVRTPNIDALAADGVVFERAYSHSPLTLPAHVSVLSGRLPFQSGVRDDSTPLPARTPLLPTVLHKRGFKTAGIVSSALLRRETGLAAGFDFYDDEMPQRTASTPEADVQRDGAVTAEIARHWVDQQGTRFFLFLHLNEPHAPYAPPARFARYAPYDGEIAYADEILGQFVAYLKQRDLYDQAVIVLLSDHGEGLGDHGEAEHGVFLYDATQRTPLVIKMPKQEGAGSRRTEIVQHIDVLPTVLDLLGAPRPSGLKGRSLRHLLDSKDATLPAPPVYAETVYPRAQFGWSELTSLTTGGFRYIKAPRPELYDLTQDRGEKENLAQSQASKAAELAAALDKVAASATPAADPAAPALSDMDRQEFMVLASEGGETKASAVQPIPSTPPAPPAVPVPADPKDVIALVERVRAADGLMAQRRFADAAGAYRALVAEDPGMPHAWKQLGAALLAAGRAKESLEAYRRALRIDTFDAAAIMGAARALSGIGKLDEAERYTLLASKLEPAQGAELLVRIELKQRDFAGARRAAAALLQYEPESPMPAFVDGVALYHAGKYEEAVPRLEEAVQKLASRDVQLPDIRFYAGDALARLRRYSDAEARFADELKWFPENVRAWESLSSVYQATGRTAEAQAVPGSMVKAAPTLEAYSAAARLCSALGDRRGASAMRDESRRRFGENRGRD